MKLLSDHLEFLRSLHETANRDRVFRIRPEIVAAKLKAIRDLEFPCLSHQLEGNPRLAELLWAIEYFFRQPGGAEKFCAEFLVENAALIGTVQLHSAAVTKDGQFQHLEELLAVWSSLPSRRREWPGCLSRKHEDLFNLLLVEEEKEIWAIERRHDPLLAEIMATLTPRHFWRVCARGAMEVLPHYLAALCNEKSKPFSETRCSTLPVRKDFASLTEILEDPPDAVSAPGEQTREIESIITDVTGRRRRERREAAIMRAADMEEQDRETLSLIQLADAAISKNRRLSVGEELKPEREIPAWRKQINRERCAVWFFDDLTTCLLAMLDRHATKVRTSIASTSVTLQVFDELEYGFTSRVGVFIAGDARYGKTTAVETWCQMRPGRCRLVTCESGGGEWEFYASHADALGIDYDERTKTRELRHQVKFVLEHSGLFICYDELHFLLPAKVSRSTKPWKMDRVRCQVVDRKLGVAFFATRQTYGQSLSQFVQKTQYQLEQWVDRIDKPLLLSGELSRDDVMIVARHNFPGFPKSELSEIAAEALGSDSPFHSLELMAKRSEFYARKAGRLAPVLEDVRAATPIGKRARARRTLKTRTLRRLPRRRRAL